VDIHSQHGERFPQRILSNARTFVNVVQHLRDFGRLEMNKRWLGGLAAFSCFLNKYHFIIT
jgi:hypothetical protein